MNNKTHFESITGQRLLHKKGIEVVGPPRPGLSNDIHSIIRENYAA
jgi:hypothetical protein